MTSPSPDLEQAVVAFALAVHRGDHDGTGAILRTLDKGDHVQFVRCLAQLLAAALATTGRDPEQWLTGLLHEVNGS